MARLLLNLFSVFVFVLVILGIWFCVLVFDGVDIPFHLPDDRLLLDDQDRLFAFSSKKISISISISEEVFPHLSNGVLGCHMLDFLAHKRGNAK